MISHDGRAADGIPEENRYENEIHIPAGQGVDLNVAWSQLFGQRFRKPVHTRFRCRVSRFTRCAYKVYVPILKIGCPFLENRVSLFDVLGVMVLFSF